MVFKKKKKFRLTIPVKSCLRIFTIYEYIIYRRRLSQTATDTSAFFESLTTTITFWDHNSKRIETGPTGTIRQELFEYL